MNVTHITSHRHDDRAFLLAPEKWVARPFCPVKLRQKNGWPITGCLVEGRGFKVYDLNIFKLPIFFELDDLLKDRQIFASFDTVEAMLQAGWVVD